MHKQFALASPDFLPASPLSECDLDFVAPSACSACDLPLLLQPVSKRVSFCESVQVYRTYSKETYDRSCIQPVPLNAQDILEMRIYLIQMRAKLPAYQAAKRKNPRKQQATQLPRVPVHSIPVSV